MWGRAFPEGWANTEFFCCVCGVEQCPTPFLWLPGTWPRATQSCLTAAREQERRGAQPRPSQRKIVLFFRVKAALSKGSFCTWGAGSTVADGSALSLGNPRALMICL